MYDCKARFQTKGDKIQKPFLLHTHPLDVKPPSSSYNPMSDNTMNMSPINVNPMDILKMNDTI